MFASLLTVFLFSLSGVSNQRVAMRLGAMLGNFARLIVATLILATIVFLYFPESLARPTFDWFFLSGIIGFGFGDICLFLALERIGSRLAVLLTLCLAPLFAIVLEWFWLGNGITWPIFGATVAILIGVAMALRPREDAPTGERRGNPKIGIIAGILSGLGQGSGAVVSRRAIDVAEELKIDINGLSAAFQRALGGLIVAAMVVLILRITRKKAPELLNYKTTRKSLVFWLFAASICGPVLGVGCFQWALEENPSGIVLAIVAITPIVMIPLAVLTEKDRPTPMAIVGAVIAVSGVVGLTLIQKWESVSTFFAS